MAEKNAPLGSAVHFVATNGQHKAGIVCRSGTDWINIQVIPDGDKDPDLQDGKTWYGTVYPDEDTKRPGTWHLPETE